VIESRAGKHTIVAVLLLLAALLGTSRPKKPRVVYPVATVLAAIAGWVAWRVKIAPPLRRSFPLGDPLAFIAAVPTHVANLAEWTRAKRLSPPPSSVAQMDEWLWDNREALGADWQAVLPGLVAAYGEVLRADTPALVWLVRDGEPAVGSPRSLWPARRIFNEVHDAIFADV
jgi:hypothetical protein